MGNFIWKVAEALVSAFWLSFLVKLLWEVASTGELAREGHTPDRFDTWFVVWMTLVLTATVAVSTRSLFKA